MNENTHQRALQLIAQARVEGMPETDRTWLRAHLEDCDFCAEHARQTDRALRLLRTAAIPVPAGLAGRTQFRVLWLACGMSWIFGVASAPYVWSLFQWLGQRTGVPKLVWEVGFGLWWSIPALFAVAVLLMESSRKGEQADWINQGS